MALCTLPRALLTRVCQTLTRATPPPHPNLSHTQIEQPGTIHHVGGWRAAVDTCTRAVPPPFSDNPAIATAMDALSAAAQRAQAAQFRGSEGRPGLSPTGRPAGPPLPLTSTRSSASVASPRSSSGAGPGPAAAGAGEDTPAAPPPPVVPLQPNVPPHLRKVPVDR